MLKRHYFIGNFIWLHAEIETTDSEVIHQIKDVLRLKENEEVVLGDGLGKAAVAVIKKIIPKEITFLVKEFLPELPASKKVILYAALLKRDSFEWLLQKATEVGVDEIVPLLCERTVKIGVNSKRWEKIIKEAAEQSQNLVLPKLKPVQNFKDAIKGKEGAIIFHPDGQEMKNFHSQGKAVHIFIGPEGGWSPTEIKLSQDNLAWHLNMGGSVLRAETAATVAVYLAKNLF
jgi:16S rRNA (uracil1498-N3)-methyltransferase